MPMIILGTCLLVISILFPTFNTFTTNIVYIQQRKRLNVRRLEEYTTWIVVEKDVCTRLARIEPILSLRVAWKKWRSLTAIGSTTIFLTSFSVQPLVSLLKVIILVNYTITKLM